VVKLPSITALIDEGTSFLDVLDREIVPLLYRSSSALLLNVGADSRRYVPVRERQNTSREGEGEEESVRARMRSARTE
jgi:hypothetical protein